MRHSLSAWIGALVLASGVAACGGGAADRDAAAADRQLATLDSVATTTATVPTIHMLGDSTMTAYAEDRRPQMGWGEAMPQFFDAGVKVDNWALGGRSSRSFYYEATRWPAILPKIGAGDYVIIQFAHNDQKSGGDYAQFGTYAFCSDGSNDGEACVGRPDKVDPTVDISEHSYYQFLKKYVQQVRARGANPILMSPIVRKYFSGTTITPQGQHNVGITGGETVARGDYVAAMKAGAVCEPDRQARRGRLARAGHTRRPYGARHLADCQPGHARLVDPLRGRAGDENRHAVRVRPDPGARDDDDVRPGRFRTLAR